MKHSHLTPQEVGLKVSRSLKKQVFEAGFEHAMKGGQLDHVEYFRLSFREGFRAAKLYLRALRKRQGVVNFPMQGRFKFKAV